MTTLATLLGSEDTGRLLAVFALAGAAVVYVRHARNPLAKIPTIGTTDLPILSFWGTLQFLLRGRQVLNEGYAKYRGRVFKVAALDRWLIIATGPSLVDELRRAPEDILSSTEGLNDLLNVENSLSPEIAKSTWHFDTIRHNLVKNMDTVVPDICDEVAAAFHDYVTFDGAESVAVTAAPLIQQVVARASNRLFLGLPACRNPEIIQIATEVSKRMMLNVFLSQILPSSLKHTIGRYLSTVPVIAKRYQTILDPILTDRRRKLEDEANGHGYYDKPDDMLMWMLEHPTGQKASLKDMTMRMLQLDFATINSTAQVTLHVLYTLAVNPDHVSVLREEAQAAVDEHGWTRPAMSVMFKLESYVKEVTRVRTFLGLAMIRKVMRPYTFSDGTTVPVGAIVAVPTSAIHQDSEIYPDADEFRPWRFVDQDEESELSTGQQFTTTSPDWVLFGGGKRACPGRFYATAEIKLILAHILLHYDVETENGERPKDTNLATECPPSETAKLIFRRRKI